MTNASANDLGAGRVPQGRGQLTVIPSEWGGDGQFATITVTPNASNALTASWLMPASVIR